MNSQAPTYMLLPDFGFAAGTDIHLGTLLLLSSKTRLPDPDLPLNPDDRVTPPSSQVKRHVEHAWHFDNSTQSHWSADLEADIPVFLPAGGGFGSGVNKSQSLAIQCELVETERFLPSRSYIAESLATDFVQEYCQKKWRPSVYMVTGLKIASKAVITSNASQSYDGHVKVKLDATSIGVPLNAGPAFEASRARTADKTTSIEGPFVLAYQLKRLRLSSKGAVKSATGFNDFALFDDQVPTENDQLDAWDVEDVLPDTVHDG